MTRNQEIASRIASAAVPVRTVVPGNDGSDLDTLRSVFEDTSAIALGESTHGARELFRAKHRLVRYLITEMNVRTLGLEMGFTQTLSLNAYLIHGDGDPEEILAGFGWLARTKSFLEMVEWLRRFNESRPPSDRVSLCGIDIGSGERSIDAVEAYLRQADPDFCGKQTEEFDSLRSYRERDGEERDERREEASRFEALLWDRFEEFEREYVATTSRAEWARANRQLDTYRQAREYTMLNAEEKWVEAREHRDQSMADNVEWALECDESDRIVLWAHDSHIRSGRIRSSMPDPAETMGCCLDRRYGDECYALGFEFGKGSFQAFPNPDRDDTEGLREWSIDSPRPGSLPAALQRVDQNPFVLDLGRAAEDERLGEWLRQEQDIHSIGGYFYENEIERHYDQSPLLSEFDGFFFVDEISRARPLGPHTD